LNVGYGIAGDVLQRAVFHQEQLHGRLRHLKVELTPLFKKTMLMREENIREGRKLYFCEFSPEKRWFSGKKYKFVFEMTLFSK
jgi:hypothetical protein